MMLNWGWLTYYGCVFDAQARVGMHFCPANWWDIGGSPLAFFLMTRGLREQYEATYSVYGFDAG